MAHTSTPSIKLVLSKDLFNRLVGILDFNVRLNIEEENLSKIANQLKEKLLTYSVPRKNEDGSEFVDVRFFPNEASNMIWQELIHIDNDDFKEDYLEILKKNRESK